MSFLVPLAIFGFVPFACLALALRPGVKTVLWLYLLGQLFLPVATFDLPGYSDFSKSATIHIGVALGTILFDSTRFARVRPHLVDVPIACFCAVPFFTSIANDLGAYNGVSSTLQQTVMYGLPYMTGRMYFADVQRQRLLATGIFVAGLLYVPLCLIEIRLSPQLHRWLYGFHQHDFIQTVRYSGYRPMVFMNHGLMVGLWMSAACLCGLALWRARALRTVRGIPLAPLLLTLLATTVLCRSTGALILLAAGVAILWTTIRFRTQIPFLLVICVPIAYVAIRGTGVWDAQEAIEFAHTFGAERAESVEFRIDNENLLSARALEQPLLGWGGFGRSMIRENPEDPSQNLIVVDGLWILVLGMYGLVGLAAYMGTFLVPLVAFARAHPPRTWHRRELAPAAALCVVAGLFWIDCLMNALVNPIYFLALGSLAGLAIAPVRRRARAPHASSRRPHALVAARIHTSS